MRHEPYSSLEELLAPETIAELAGVSVTTVCRLPLVGAESFSGSNFLTIQTNDGDGPRFVVKRVSLEWDWIMRATGDDRGREVLAWTTGFLDRLPPEIAHPVLGCARDGAGWAILMRDVGDTLFPPHDVYLPPLTWEDHCRFLDAMAALHVAFWEKPHLVDLGSGFCDAWHRYQAFSMKVAQREAVDPDAPPRFLRLGWSLLPNQIDPSVAERFVALANEPRPLCAALDRYPQTAVHGDLRTANLGLLAPGKGAPGVVLLDWHFLGPGTPGADLTWYLRETVGPKSGIVRETVIEAYRDRLAQRLGPRFDEAWWQPQLDLSCLGLMVRMGWDMAETAVHHPDASVRDRAREDLVWWGGRALAAMRWL